MLAYRHVDRVAIALVLLALLVLGMLSVVAAGQTSGVEMQYEDALFDSSQFLTIDIQISAEDWQSLLDNATAEEYYACDVVIDGVTYANVGIRAKGNTSLSMVAASGSDRYSLKIQFDEYVDGQTCMGLDKLVLNNNYADATMLREAIVYDMFDFLDADASLWNYASLSVNGEYWGVYLALEAVEESFALRNYGVDYGELYKPDSMDMGGAGKMQGVDIGDIEEMFQGLWQTDTETGAETTDSTTDTPAMPSGGMPEGMTGELPDSMPEDMPEGFDPTDRDGGNGGGGFDFGGFGSASAASLNYLGDDLDSYSTIWESSVFDSSDADHRRVVTALAHISSGEELETYLDVDNLLRYMAVHTFVVNLDSLSGNMAHNYYLYEEDGQLNLVPWDYNLSFGGFQGGDASSVVNFPIDTPFSGVSESDRSFFMALLNDETYLAQYHQYLQLLVDEYVNGWRLEALYTALRAQLDPLVAEDPTAFYTYEEYDTAAEMLMETIRLRAESIAGQLDGTIPSTTDGQSADSSALIDSSAIDLSVMGTMGGGGGGGFSFDFGGMGGGRGGERPDDTGTVPDGGTAPEGDSAATGIQTSAGGAPEGTGDAASGEAAPDATEGATESATEGATGGEATQPSGDFSFPGGDMSFPDGQSFEGFEGFDPSSLPSSERSPDSAMSMGNAVAESSTTTQTLITYGVCLALMLLALLWIRHFRRR